VLITLINDFVDYFTGTYSNQTNLMYQTECDDCPGGYYCLEEGLTEPSGLCGEGNVYLKKNTFRLTEPIDLCGEGYVYR
jgi:hypothetical protein